MYGICFCNTEDAQRMNSKYDNQGLQNIWFQMTRYWWIKKQTGNFWGLYLEVMKVLQKAILPYLLIFSYLDFPPNSINIFKSYFIQFIFELQFPPV